jgi:hypothetical protein
MSSDYNNDKSYKRFKDSFQNSKQTHTSNAVDNDISLQSVPRYGKSYNSVQQNQYQMKNVNDLSKKIIDQKYKNTKQDIKKMVEMINRAANIFFTCTDKIQLHQRNGQINIPGDYDTILLRKRINTAKNDIEIIDGRIRNIERLYIKLKTNDKTTPSAEGKHNKKSFLKKIKIKKEKDKKKQEKIRENKRKEKEIKYRKMIADKQDSSFLPSTSTTNIFW